MADNPYAQYATNPYAVYGAPREPAPQTPAQATQDQLQAQHLQQQIDQTPLQNENTRVNIAQGQTSIQNQRFNQNQGLRQEFNALPEVKNYSSAIQSLGTALKAPDSPQGDLAIVYAFAKAMDPGSVVREGEMDMATATASIPQAYQADVARLTQGKRLPPQVRTGLIEAMRQSVGGLRQNYDQQRSRYEALAQQNGFDPSEIVGKPLYDAYRPLEESYIRAHGGTPRVNGVPVDAPPPTKLNPEQQQAFFDILDKQGPDAANEYLGQFGLALKDKGAAAKPHSNEVLFPPEAVEGFKEGVGGVVQGVGDVLGIVSNPVIQGVNAITGSNYRPDFGANLRDAFGLPAASTPQQELVNKVGGAALGGLGIAGLARGAIPYVGETVGNALSGLAVNPGGDAVISGASGGSSELARQNGYGPGAQLLAGLAGGAVSAPAASRIAPTMLLPTNRNALLQTSRPPLVDQTTGRLNEPLEAAGPAARIDAAKQFDINLPMGSAGDRTAAIIERKLDVRPASAGVMNDSRRVVETQAQNAAENVAGRFGQSRTLNEGGAELQRGAIERNDRAANVITKAYSAIPIADTAPASNANTVATLQQLTSRFQSNPELAEALKDPKLATYLDAIQKGISWKDLKQFRSIIGEKIGEFRVGENSSTSDLRGLYAALSDDMRATAAAAGPKALRSFERANTLNRQNEELVQGALTRILGKDGQLAPEKAAAAVQAMTKGGKSTGDLKTLAQIKGATVKSGAWDEIAGTMIRIGGQPADSPGRGFDPATFVRWYSDMAEPARAMLFKPELRKTLDQFVAVNQRMANSNALRNTSNTAMASPSGTFSIPSAVALLFTGHPILAGGLIAGTALKSGGEYTMAKVWTDPKFVQWATGYSRAVASGNPNAVKSQIGRIGTLATANPELREPLIALQQRLLSGVNDNAMRSAAASRPNSEEQ